MRSYGQFCGIAKALDVIGDRWTILIVRELLIRDQCRWTDLKNGLPGIAPNLLAERIRELEAHGIVTATRQGGSSPAALFSLTPRGRDLEPALHALGHWGAALLKDPARCRFQTHWLTLPLREHLRDQRPDDPPATLELRTGDEPLSITAAGGAITIQTGTAGHPDAVISGPPETVLALMTGKIDLQHAQSRRARYLGDPSLLHRMRPVADPGTPAAPSQRREARRG